MSVLTCELVAATRSARQNDITNGGEDSRVVQPRGDCTWPITSG